MTSIPSRQFNRAHVTATIAKNNIISIIVEQILKKRSNPKKSTSAHVVHGSQNGVVNL